MHGKVRVQEALLRRKAAYVRQNDGLVTKIPKWTRQKIKFVSLILTTYFPMIVLSPKKCEMRPCKFAQT